MAERVLSVRLRAIVDDYVTAMGRAAGATERVAGVGERMVDAGRKATLGFTVPMAAAGGVAVKAAMDFESAFAGVEKTVDGTAEQMGMLSQGIVDMSKQLPAGTTEIAGVAEAAGQLGIEVPNILGFTRTMIDLGEATDVAAQDAAISLAQLANITQMPQEQFDRLGSSVVAMGNNFPAFESQIIDMSQRLASAGSQIGMTEAEIVGFSTALASVGMEAQAGGTAISRVMIEVASAVSAGSAELEDWARAAGMSASQFASLFREDAASAMSALVTGLGDVSDAGGDLFGVLEQLGVTETRTRDSLLRLAGAGDMVTRAVGMSTEAWSENTALTEEASARYATLESRLAMAKNRVTDIARVLGEALMPAVNLMLGGVNVLLSGAETLTRAFAALPSPIQAVAGSIVALGAAVGPGLWVMGKLVTLAGPLALGMVRLAVANGRTAVSAIASAKGMTIQAVAAGGLRAAMLGAVATVGPWLALAAAMTAAGVAIHAANKRAQELQTRHLAAADAARQLAESAGLATTELRKMNDAADETPDTDAAYAEANRETLASLREIADEAGQLAYLREIGYEMVLRGAAPEDVLEAVEKLAKHAGVEIPVAFTVEDVNDVDSLIDASVERAERAVERMSQTRHGAQHPRSVTAPIRLEMEAVASNAETLWNTDQTAAMVQLLAETEAALGGNARAAEHLGVSLIKAIDPEGELGFKTSKIHDIGDAIAQIIDNPNFSEKTKEQLAAIRDSAAEMEGGLTNANWAIAASAEATGESAEDAAERVKTQSDVQAEATASSEEFADSLERMGGALAFARMDFDASAAAAQAFARSLDESTRTASRLSAGLRGGQALKSLREGMTGEKAAAEARAETAKQTEKAASAVDRLGDAARRADPKLSGFNLRLESLSAAGSAFRESLDNSTMIDDQISQALSLGDAYKSFEKTYRRLPVTLDMTAVATGKLRPRTADAVQNMLSLGRAARDWLGVLIEMGKTDAEVAGTAAQMRQEYSRMFREMGMGEAQVRQYIEAMGLLPEQVTTAIKVSGLEAARTRLTAYLSLLEGRIPPEVATSVIASLEADDVEGAAARLAEFARSNPALIEVQVDDTSIDRTRERIDEVRANLWDLPREFDPLKAMLGGYTDAQQAALEGVMAFGDAAQAYLSQVAHDGNAEEIRDQAYRIRDGFLEAAGFGADAGRAYEDMSAGARAYLDLIGLSDWQIDSAINLSGDAEAMFRIQTYAQFMGDTIPPEVASKVMALIDQGKLQEAADELEAARRREEAKPININVKYNIPKLIDDGYMAMRGTPTLVVPGQAAGGVVHGVGTGTSDSNLRALSRGEFVVREAAARSNYAELEAFNRTGDWPSQQWAPAAPSGPVSLDDASIRKLAEHMGGGDSFDVTVYSPSERQTPRRVAEAVGARARRR